jgi:hypothetical protein
MVSVIIALGIVAAVLKIDFCGLPICQIFWLLLSKTTLIAKAGSVSSPSKY